MNSPQLLAAVKITILSFQVPLLAYLCFYASYKVPQPYQTVSPVLAILSASIALVIGSRILWQLTTRSPK